MAKAKPITEQEILEMMNKLHCSREDAVDVIECDRDIDRGEETYFDLSKEKEKEALREAHKGNGRTNYTFTKRERKPNETKREIIDNLFHYLTECGYSGVVVTKPEGEIDLKVGDTCFTVRLVQHRPPKEK